MTLNINQYIKDLKKELVDCDPATIQDAISDTKEHLHLALEQAQHQNPDADDADLLSGIIEEYGTPQETALAYRTIEDRLWSKNEGGVNRVGKSLIARFFGIYGDSRAWGALIYMLITLITGVLYFTWVFAGFSFSLIAALFIFGLFIAGFFTISVKGLAVLEGRIIEGLLGVQMPRRPGD